MIALPWKMLCANFILPCGENHYGFFLRCPTSFYNRPIENDVWIGQNSVILPGVHIGDGAIIGANSVVGSDVPPYTKVVGNPARAIQKRFDDELIELLLRFKWWDRSIDEINRLIPILTCSDLDKVKAEIKKQLG